MTMTMSVGMMGFSPYEERKLKKILALSEKHNRLYQLNELINTEVVDLLITKEANDFVSEQLQAYQARHKNKFIRIIKAGREASNSENQDYIKGVLVPSRVFSVLDKIELHPKIIESSNASTDNERITSATESLPIATATKVQKSADILQILVVDDSVMMQKTVQMELDKATVPLSTDFADTGEMALDKVKLKKYDVIFLDVMMPGIDGFETCSQIRKLEGMAKTPIIMLTSKTSAMDEVKGLMAGCTTYLTKPFEHEEFQKMLERIMQWVKEFNERK